MSKEELRLQELKIKDEKSVGSDSEFDEDFDDDDDDESIYEKGKTEVYLGLVDANIKESDEVTIEDTFIGGDPLWLHPDSEPDEKLLKCSNCQSAMKLLLQAFAPVDKEQVESIAAHTSDFTLGTTEYLNSNDDRVLYVFVCLKCSRNEKSVRCIRGIKKNSNKNSTSLETLDTKPEKVFDFSGISGSASSNPFATDSSNPFGSASANPFSVATPAKEETTSAATQDTKPTAKTLRKIHDKQADKQFSGFPGYYVYVEAESFKNKTPDHLKIPENIRIDENAIGGEEELLESFKNQNKNGGSGSGSMDPRTEKLSKILDDDTFQKFQEVVGYNPGQVLRYDLGGEPLLYCETPVTGGKSRRNKTSIVQQISVPNYNPSSRRVFEMQLMPKMIIDLEDSVSIADGMEWGTILVFTDLENYIPHFDTHGCGYVEEVCKVQWEPRE